METQMVDDGVIHPEYQSRSPTAHRLFWDVEVVNWILENGGIEPGHTFLHTLYTAAPFGIRGSPFHAFAHRFFCQSVIMHIARLD